MTYAIPPSKNDCLATRKAMLAKVVAWLEEIGLPVERAEVGAPGTFIHGIEIKNGGLRVADDAFPGDVLHEAGHLCLLPSQFRSLADGSLTAALKALMQYLRENPEGLFSYPEDPLCRTALQYSDPEVTAWQYAAALHLELPEDWIFPQGSYLPEGHESILQRLKSNAYAGINGLQAMGWTALSSFSPARPKYPLLNKWVHP